MPYQGIYGASKHALGTLSESLAGEVEPFSIRVVAIERGAGVFKRAAGATTEGAGGANRRRLALLG